MKITDRAEQTRTVEALVEEFCESAPARAERLALVMEPGWHRIKALLSVAQALQEATPESGPRRLSRERSQALLQERLRCARQHAAADGGDLSGDLELVAVTQAGASRLGLERNPGGAAG